MSARLKSPYPYFGGKSRIAPIVWKCLGDCKCYLEPFFGWGAVLLARPRPFAGKEVINDLDGHVANFWRAIKADPNAVVEHADHPCFENDFHARNAYLRAHVPRLQARLEGNPDYFDARIAGWWVWGMSIHPGLRFGWSRGPWRVKTIEGLAELVRDPCGAKTGLTQDSSLRPGISRERPNTYNNCGVFRKLPSTPADSQAGASVCRREQLRRYFALLADRLRDVKVLCGGWERAVARSTIGPLSTCKPVGVFLDPPYTASANRDNNLYRYDDTSIGERVKDWAVAHGDDPTYRIALCGFAGEYEMPRTWREVAWKSSGGYAAFRRNGVNTNRYKERLWLSPHCLDHASALAI